MPNANKRPHEGESSFRGDRTRRARKRFARGLICQCRRTNEKLRALRTLVKFYDESSMALLAMVIT